MPTSPLLGRVVVVAGDDERLSDVVVALLAAQALVAAVSTRWSAGQAQAFFRADPLDTAVWQRVAPHVEQRLGPVDAVVADAATSEVARAVFGPDLRRRGHGAVVVLTDDDDVGAVVSRLLDTH